MMRRLLILFGVILAALVLFFGGAALLSETKEVVVLHTRDASGGEQGTRLWVVEDGGAIWLRAGDPQSAWYARLRAEPDVELTRGEERRAYRALPSTDPATRERINRRMATKYGLADRWIGLFSDRTRSVPIRLTPR